MTSFLQLKLIFVEIIPMQNFVTMHDSNQMQKKAARAAQKIFIQKYILF